MIYGSWNIRCNRQNFLSFWAIFCPFCPLTTQKITTLKSKKNKKHLEIFNEKWQSYDVGLLRYGAWQTEFFVVLDRFLPFYSPMDPENQNFEKMKKTSEDIITLQMCTRNDSHMMYGSWDMECKRQKFLLFWNIFCPFYPLNNLKNQNFQNMKKYLQISFYMCVP